MNELIPERFSSAKEAVQAQVICVMASMLDLVGRQLAYLHTFASKFGKIYGSDDA